MGKPLRDDEDDNAFMRSIMWAEEDRHRFTSVPWTGGFRWFRSANVVCLEQYRRRRTPSTSEEGK